MARVGLLLHTTGGETRLPEALQEDESGDEWDDGQDTVAGARTGPCRFEWTSASRHCQQSARGRCRRWALACDRQRRRSRPGKPSTRGTRRRAGLINAISHFAFPIIKGGYFTGVYTATGHLVMSALLIYLIVKESRRVRTEAVTGIRAKLDLTDM